MKLQQPIHALFSELADRTWDRTALVSGDQHRTYGQLAEQSNRIAHYLKRHGVARGQRVGLYAERSMDAVAAMLGILKAGAAYVPFDPSYPTKLLRFVYEDCSPALMLLQSSLTAFDGERFWDGAVHDIQHASGETVGQDGHPALPETGPEDVAYVMYTSGSTGHPKGVLIPHRGVVRLVIDNPFAAMGPDEVHLQLAPLAFDASTFEIWGALLNGAQLAIAPSTSPSLDEIADSIARYRVTTLWLTAGLFHLMVDHRLQGLAPLRQLLAGGDVLSPSHVAKAQAALPSCQLINGYGPTENTTFTCCYRIPRDGAPGPIPIGTPIANTDVYVLDETGSRVPDGAEGELHAGGAGLALGYLNRDDLTSERFIRNPFDPTGQSKLYRTGDRVRRRSDGNFEFLGRGDRQVKISGKRIELDEVEAYLRASPLVEDAAVTCPAPSEGTPKKIHAYVKLRQNSPNSINDLREFLKREAPDYMMPATLTVLAAMPMSPMGKVDRSRLPPPQNHLSSVGSAQLEGRNEVEKRLLEIWRTVLGTPPLGVNDNFFDLGGTSLQLIQVHATIVSSIQSDVTVVDLFQYPRISALAARLVAGARNGSSGGDVTDAAERAGLTAEERARRRQTALTRARTSTQRKPR